MFEVNSDCFYRKYKQVTSSQNGKSGKITSRYLINLMHAYLPNITVGHSQWLHGEKLQYLQNFMFKWKNYETIFTL